jgi:hypothetical protein
MLFFRFTLFAVAGFLAGCSFQKPSSDAPAQTQATVASWLLTPVLLEGSEGSTTDSWGLPANRTYHFRTCARDKATQQARVGQEFTVESGSGLGQALSIHADAEGCLRWTRTVSFRYLASETYVEISENIRSGAELQVVHLAVNPWRSGGAGALDLSTTDRATLVRLSHHIEALSDTSHLAESLAQSNIQSNLQVPSLQLDLPEPEQDGSHSVQRASLRIQVSALRPALEGTWEEAALASGDIRIRAVLIEKVKGVANPEPFALLKAAPKTSLEQGWLESELTFQLQRAREQGSELDLVLQLVPAPSPTGILPWKGIFLVSASEKQSGRPMTLPAMDPTPLDVVLSTTEAAPKGEVAAGAANSVSALVIGKTSARATAPRIGENWQAVSEVVFEACLLGATQLRAAAPKQAFAVQWARGGQWDPRFEARVISDEAGCVHWKQPIEFPYAAAESYWDGSIIVKGVGGQYEGATAVRRSAVNPWQTGEHLFWDTESLLAPPVNPEADKPAALVLSRYDISQKGDWEYLVDTFLQLVQKREVNVSLYPILHRPYSFDKAPKNVEIPLAAKLRIQGKLSRASGKSRLKGAERRVSDPGFISSFETLSKVSRVDRLDTTGAFAIPFLDLHWLELGIHFELNVTAESAVFAPQPARALGLFNGLMLRNQQESKNLIDLADGQPLPNQPEGLAETEKAWLSYGGDTGGTTFYVDHPFKQPPLHQLAEYWSNYSGVQLQVADTDEKLALPANKLITSRVVTELPTGNAIWDFLEHSRNSSEYYETTPEPLDQATVKKILAPFCVKTAGPAKTSPQSKAIASASKQAHAPCEKDPSLYFSLHTFTVFENVKEEARKIQGVRGSSAIASTFFNERKFTEAKVEGNSDRISRQFGAFSKSGYGRFDSSFVPFQVSVTKDDQVYSNDEAIYAKDTRSGLRGSNQVSLERTGLELEFDATTRECLAVLPLPSTQLQWQTPIQIYCATKKSKTYRERWYTLSDGVAANTLLDSGDEELRGWYKALRGNDAFAAFDRLLSDSIRDLKLNKIESFHDGVDRLVGGVLKLPPKRSRAKNGDEEVLRDPVTARLFADGSVFMGVWGMQEYSGVMWNESEIRNLVDICTDDLIAKQVELTVATRYCRCFYTEAAQTWQHGVFTESSQSARDNTRLLHDSGTYEWCRGFAKHSVKEPVE